jgi:hypothetical protein
LFQVILSQTPPQMENPFLSWLRSNSFFYDFVPAVLCVGHNDQTTRYVNNVICLSSLSESRRDNIAARFGRIVS